MHTSRVDGEVHFDDQGGVPPLLPEGDHYHVYFVRAERASFGKNQQKLYLHFKVYEPSDHRDEVLWLPCNVPSHNRFGSSSKYWLLWTKIANRRPRKDEKLTTRVFKNKIFLARVRTVRQTSRQEIRTPAQQYSIIDDLLETVAGGPTCP